MSSIDQDFDDYSLRPGDIETGVRLVTGLLQVREQDAFVQLLRQDLRQLIPFTQAICGVGRINPHSITCCELISIDFPLAYFEDIRQTDGGIYSPLMQRWIDRQEPVVFEPAEHGSEVSEEWLAIFHRHGLRNSLAHGLRDLNSPITSYFNFCGIDQLSGRHSWLLRLLMPHLHIAITRLVAEALRRPSGALPQLTPREKEVVSWLYLGKTNWEIGQILGIAEKTVKNNLSAIFDKLAVNNRTQLLARITELKLLG